MGERFPNRSGPERSWRTPDLTLTLPPLYSC